MLIWENMIQNTLNNYPTLDIERALWANEALWIAGIDEAGRGALAGPVIAAAVVLPQITNLKQELNGVRDSKRMSPVQRDLWSRKIREKAVTHGIGLASSREIDQLGILPATKLAAFRAINKLAVVPDHLMLDHFQLPDLAISQTSIAKGDVISLSIAAASVLAKTARDAILCDLNSRYPGYRFNKHKGYGTRIHVNALKTLGPSPIHRMTFAPIKDMCKSD
jgi:ribonuclease HII